MISKKKFVLLSVTLGLIILSVNLIGQNKTLKNTEPDSIRKSFLEYPTIYKIYCSGTGQNDENCSVIVGSSDRILKCNCKECLLTIESNKGKIDLTEENRLITELSNLEIFTDYLEEFVLTEFHTDDFSIEWLEYSSYQNNYYVYYEIITSKGEKETVFYLSSANANDTEPRKQVQINCFGTEKYTGKNCFEKYIFQIHQVECSGQSSDCKMHVKEL